METPDHVIELSGFGIQARRTKTVEHGLFLITLFA
jgi:hypothetical protein